MLDEPVDKLLFHESLPAATAKFSILHFWPDRPLRLARSTRVQASREMLANCRRHHYRDVLTRSTLGRSARATSAQPAFKEEYQIRARRGAARDTETPAVLVVSRKVGERILIGDKIAITVVKVSGGGVRIGIEAPAELAVMREELAEEIRKAERAAMETSDFSPTDRAAE